MKTKTTGGAKKTRVGAGSAGCCTGRVEVAGFDRAGSGWADAMAGMIYRMFDPEGWEAGLATPGPVQREGVAG